MRFQWPKGFRRVPDQPWASAPLESLALKYDTVEGHGWYANLEPTIDQLLAYLEPGHLLLDYSGGTGILVDRLLRRAPDLDAGILIVDSSPKFLRLAQEKLGADERVALRWIEYLKAERRLQRLEEALEPALLARGVDALASTNAIHLYYELPATLASWFRVLRPGAAAFVQSGNIGNPGAGSAWIIDETVEAIHRCALALVGEEQAYAPFRPALEDEARLERYAALRRKFFLPVRPLSHYTDALRGAGFALEAVEARTIRADVDEWYEFLAVYHEGVLGWAGGSERIEGRPPAADAVELRLRLMRAAMDRLFEGRSFEACWTYLTCRRPA